MGHDDLRTPVQPAGSQDRRGNAREQNLMITARGTQQGSAQYIPKDSLLLTLTGQQISHRNFQAAGNGAANQNHAIKNALRSDERWQAHSDHNLPIPASNPELTFSEQDMRFVQSVEASGSCHATTLPMSVTPYNSMPITSSTTVLESPMVSTSPSFQGLPVTSVTTLQSQPLIQQNLQQQDASYQTEPASLEDLMHDCDDEALPMDAVCSAATPGPQFNQCPTGTGGGNAGGGSQAESGSGGQSTFVTGYSTQNYSTSMVAGGNGGGGLGGSGGDDDPFNSNYPIQLQRDHYADGNVFTVSEAEDLLRFIEGDLEEVRTQGQAFIPTLQTSEIFSEIDNLPGGLATTPGDNNMAYYSKFDLSGDSLQPMEESSCDTDPVPAAPQTPRRVCEPTTPVSVPASDPIGNSFDMIKLMKKQKKVPILSRPSDLTFQPPSPAGSYMSTPSPASMPPSTPYPVQVSTPQRQEALPLQIPPKPQQQERAPSMPPPSPASPPTPANVRPFDCQRYEENGKMYLEMLVRKDLPEADRRFTLTAFFHAAQFCMDLGETMRNPCDLKVSNHICANICDFRFDSAQSKLVFSIPSNCKHVYQWVTERGAAASFLDRCTVLQQVLNTMATIHNKKRDASLWGCFMVFVAPDLRVYMIPDIVPMLCKMQATVGDHSFNPRFEDSKAVFELYERLIPPTINQNSSWISPGVSQLLESFSRIVCDPSSVFRMAEIARILGEKMMCRMEVDYLGLGINIFCVEHELVLKALSSIQSMVPDGATIVWVPSGQPVAIQDLATAVRPMRLGVFFT